MYFDHASYASTLFAVIMCPFVRPSQVGVVQTQLNLGSHWQRCAPRDSSFLMPKVSMKFQPDHP